MVPVLTFGWLSAVPFLHAGSRLRDRRVLLLAGVYAAGGAVAFTLLALAPVDAQGDPDWRGDVGLGLGVVLAGSACVLLIRIRRRVFSAPTAHNGALHPAPHDDRAEVTSPEDVPPVTWAELPRVLPEDSNQEAPSTTQDAQPQATAVAPGRTPWEQGEVTSPAGGGLPPKAASPALGTTFGLEVGCAAVAFWIAWVLLIGVATCVSEDTCTHLIGAAWTVLMAAHPVLVAVCGAMFIVGSWKKQDALKRRAVWVLPVGLAAAWVVFLVLLDPTAAAGALKEIFSALTGIPT